MNRRQFLQIGMAAVPGVLGCGSAWAETGQPRRFRFFLWSDMHVRAGNVPNRPPGYPCAEEKAAWATDCACGQGGIEPPDFVVSAGDIIDGELSDYSLDFAHLRKTYLDRLKVPFLPCVGNHENEQGEGIPERNHAYDQCFGPRWHNYVFTCGGIGFVMVDTSGADHQPDSVTAARNTFVDRAMDFLAGMPIIVVTHVPLIAMREEAPLKQSFGFSSWQVLDLGMLQRVRRRSDSVVAVLAGHLHLTAARKDGDITHITTGGTCGYPADFASFDVYDDRIEVRMHKAPSRWLDRGGNIHGKPRHPKDYTDATHPDHESYLWGNPDERTFAIPLAGSKRPGNRPPRDLTVHHETAPGKWETARLAAWKTSEGR